MSVGDDETEAGRRAMQMLRNEGVDIRVKQVCVVEWSVLSIVSRPLPVTCH